MLRSATQFLYCARLCYLPSSSLYTSPYVNRWYRGSFLVKRSGSQPKKVVVLPDDCENQSYESLNTETIWPEVSQLSNVQSLDEQSKKVFTYRFSSKKEILTDAINAKLSELGYHPTDTSTAAKVIRMTMLLRYKKAELKKFPKNNRLLFATKALINARIYTLRLLRATDLSEFNRLTKALEITEFRHPNPFELFANDPLTKRLRAVRDECYHSRLGRLADLKVQLASTEEDFYKRKEATLAKLLQDLEPVADWTGKATAAERRQKAEQMLHQLFQEVVAERQAEVLKEPEHDQFHWFEWEQDQRERYERRMKTKAMKQLKAKKR